MSLSPERNAGIPPHLFDIPMGKPHTSESLPDFAAVNGALHGLLSGRESWRIEEDHDCEEFEDLEATAIYAKLRPSVRGLIMTVRGDILTNTEINLSHQASVRHGQHAYELHKFVFNLPFEDPDHPVSISLEPRMGVITGGEQTDIRPIKRLEAEMPDGTVINPDFPDVTKMTDRAYRRTLKNLRRINKHPYDKQVALFTDLAADAADHRLGIEPTAVDQNGISSVSPRSEG
jgi:hypothetical protein